VALDPVWRAETARLATTDCWMAKTGMGSESEAVNSPTATRVLVRMMCLPYELT